MVSLPKYEALLVEALQRLAIDSGTVTSAVAVGGNALMDTAKNWQTDVHRYRLVKIIKGVGAGQAAYIQTNTDNTLVIYGSWRLAIGVGATYVILSADIAQILRDVFGGGSDISAANPLEVHDPKVGSLISYEGTATANGAPAGASVVDANLVTQPDFDGNEIIITSGAYAGQARDINGATNGGTVTPSLNFGGQILAGTTFIIAAIRTVPAEVAALTLLVQALMADLGDASTSTLGSILAILGDPAQTFLAMVGYEGAASLANKLTEVRAGYLDELAAANVPADIDTLLTRVTAAVALASALATHDTDIKADLATIIGYIDTEVAAILAAVDTEVAAIETKLDTPANFMADLTTLETRLSATRAGYLDELAAANLPTDIAALATSQGRMLFTMDFWSDFTEEKAVTNAQVTAAVGAAVVVHDLPAGATVVIAKVMMKFRMVENTNAAENSLDCTAVQPIQVDDSGDTGWLTAIDFVDEQFKIAATTREGGDVLIGDNNVAARVDGNDTYDFQWLNARAHLANIQFNDIQMGIRIWYSI